MKLATTAVALAVGISAAILTTAPVTSRTQAGPRAAAQTLLQELVRSTGTPAVSAAVAVHGRIVFASGAGQIDLEHRVVATGDSVYNIGSVSKAITGVAILQLLETRKISFEDDIRDYVAAFPDKGERITLRHLLTHTSGIRHYRSTDFPGTPDNENIRPIASYLDGLAFFAADPLLFRPGTRHLYTSYGVNLLQGVIEGASGLGLETYLRERIWDPAGMATAGLDIPERIVPHRARSYRIEQGRAFNYYYNDLRYKFTSGGMTASPIDLVRFGAAINSGRLLSAASREEMYRPQTKGVPEFREEGSGGSTPQGREQGILWDLRRDAAGRPVAYHCGSVKAFNACIVNFYEEDLVAALATNSWECCGWSKADQLAALFRR